MNEKMLMKTVTVLTKDLGELIYKVSAGFRMSCERMERLENENTRLHQMIAAHTTSIGILQEAVLKLKEKES